jgi:nucleotide-binding universal stress UspA family protein
MKSILVAIDHTNAAQAAQALAIELALRHNARLTGLGILDRAALARPEPVPVGGMAYKLQRDQDLIEQERQFLAQAMESFMNQCRVAEIEPRPRLVEGRQLETLEREAACHDLIVVGRDTEFTPFEADRPRVSQTVQELLRASPRPLLVTPPDPLCGDGLLVIYDGSPASERLLQILTMLGLLEGWRVEVLALARAGCSSEQNAEDARDYLAEHGVSANTIPANHNGDDEDVILKTAQELNAKIVAIAAGVRQDWRRLWRGSLDHHLLQHCASAVLVYR